MDWIYCEHNLEMDERFDNHADAINVTHQLLIIKGEKKKARASKTWDDSLRVASITPLVEAKLFQKAVIDAFAAIEGFQESGRFQSYYDLLRKQRNQFCHSLRFAPIVGDSPELPADDASASTMPADMYPYGPSNKAGQVHDTKLAALENRLIAPFATLDGKRIPVHPLHRALAPTIDQLEHLLDICEDIMRQLMAIDLEKAEKCQICRPRN